MEPPRIVVVGSLVTDLVARVPRHPRVGETVLGTSFQTYLGGKGFNQCLAARRLGARVDLVGRVGADAFGDTFLAALEADDVGHAHVLRDPEGTGVAVPIVDDRGQNMIVMVPRANIRLAPAHVAAAGAVIAAARAVLLQLEVPVETCVAAARAARAAGALVVWNLAPWTPVPDGAPALADVVVVNEAEAGAMLEVIPDSPHAAIAACQQIRDRGADAVVVTLGAGGAVYADARGSGHVPAFSVNPVDTVGAGDAFVAALALSLARGESLAAAVRHGNAAGALATTVHGAAPSMPTADAVRALLERA